MSVEEKKEQLASLIGQAIERTASARGVTLPEGFSVLLDADQIGRASCRERV